MKTTILLILNLVSLASAGEIASLRDLPHELQIVAITLLGEARGEGREGIYAVACVLEQRSRETNRELSAVCRKPYQFSVWNSSSFSDLSFLLDKKGPIFDYTLELVQNWDSVKPELMKNANHYHANTIKTPYWGKGKEPVKIVGNHMFYKL